RGTPSAPLAASRIQALLRLHAQLRRIERLSCLPHTQHHRRDLARQRDACHRRPLAALKQTLVEVPERAGAAHRRRRRSLEDLLEHPVAVPVQAARHRRPPPPHRLPVLSSPVVSWTESSVENLTLL